METSVSKRLTSNRKTHFLASIPWAWVCEAAKGPGKSLQVALAIWHQTKLEKNRTISLGSRFLNDLNVSKDAKARGLAYLEGKQLIKAEHKAGSNPSVTVLDI